jgi:tetratricopeptide (TPR) repeat protein
MANAPEMANAEAGVAEYQTCRNDEADADSRIFACSRILADPAQPKTIVAKVFLNRGDAYFASDKCTEATADYSFVILLGAADPQTHYKRGICYYNAREYHRAVLDATEAIEKKEKEGRQAKGREARDGEARGREAKDREAKDREAKDREAKEGEAKAREAKGREAKGGDLYLYYNLRGDAYKGMGRRKDAIADYRKSLKLEPDSEANKAALDGLKELGAGR